MRDMERRHPRLRLLPALAAAAALAARAAGPAPAAAADLPAALFTDRGEEGAAYSLSADAAAGFLLAAGGSGFDSSDSSAAWSLSANLLHRLDAAGWGLVLNHGIELSGGVAGAAAAAGAAGSVQPAVAVHEGYARADLGPEGQVQLFVGKRRMGLGLGTVFSPGDAIDPRTGFWDQKSGFRGLSLAASLGSELSLRAALSLERGLDAYAAGLHARSAAAAAGAELAATAPTALVQASAAAAGLAYEEALDGAAGPADPRLLTGALSLDATLGPLQLAAAGVYRPGALGRASAGLGLDAGGLILQAEGAVELLADGASPEAPAWFGTAGARYSWSGEAASLTLSLDYGYNGAAGDLLARTHYLLPAAILSWTEVLDLTCRALLELEGPSALASGLLALHPARDYGLELSLLAGLGDPGEGSARDATALPGPLSPGSGELALAAGLAARVHF